MIMPLFGPPNVGKLKEKRDINGLLHALEEKNSWLIPSNAEDALLELVEPGDLPVLLKALGHKHHRVRKVVAECLGKIRQAEALLPLLRAFETDEDDKVRQAAVEALGQLGDKRAVPKLIAALYEVMTSRGFIPTDLVIALGALGDPQAVDVLCAALELSVRRPARGGIPDPSPARAIEALEKVGGLKHRRAIEALTLVVNQGENRLLRSKAESMLEKITPQPEKPAAQASKPAVDGEKKPAQKPKAGSSEPLLQLVDDITSADINVRLKAAEALGSHPEKKKAVNYLILYVRQHPRWEVRISAAHALGEIGDQSAAQDLVALYTEAVGTHAHEVTSQLPWIVGALDKLGWKPGPGGWRPGR
jgi:HEAT repeat protein